MVNDQKGRKQAFSVGGGSFPSTHHPPVHPRGLFPGFLVCFLGGWMEGELDFKTLYNRTYIFSFFFFMYVYPLFYLSHLSSLSLPLLPRGERNRE